MTSYSFSPIDVPGAKDTFAAGINDLGTIVGSFEDKAGHLHGFVDNAGHFSKVDVPGAAWTEITGINNLGQMVGDYGSSSGSARGFLDSWGHISTIDMPGATGTSLGGINDWGEIVGTAQLPPSNDSIKQEAFVDTRGHFSAISVPAYPNVPYDAPGGTYMWGAGINDRCQITIEVATPPGSFGGNSYIDSHGVFTAMNPPGSILAPGIGGLNNLGTAVGSYTAAPQGGAGAAPQFGYVYSHGTYTSLAWPGSSGTYAAGINDLGSIVGSHTDSSGTSDGFLARPDMPPLNIASLLGKYLPGFLRG